MKSHISIFAILSCTVNAFSPASVRQKTFRTTNKFLANAGSNSEDTSDGWSEEFSTLLNNAEECAHSDTCSLDDTLHYYSVLNSVSEGGAVAMELNNELYASQIQSTLEELKTKLNDLEKAWLQRQTTTALTVSSAPLLLMAIMAMYSSYMMAHSYNNDVVPFEWEEVKMAISGGYLDTLIGHFLKHGGL